jgi:hypothetical protein
MGDGIAYSALLWDEHPSYCSSIPVTGERSLPQSVQTGSGVHPASYLVGTDVFSLGVKLPVVEADCPPPPSIFEVKGGWCYTTAPPYVIVACTGTILLLPLHMRWQLFSVCYTSGQKNGCGQHTAEYSYIARQKARCVIRSSAKPSLLVLQGYDICGRSWRIENMIT